jgi:hypothetical protein
VLFSKIIKNEIFATKIKELKNLLEKNISQNKGLNFIINKDDYRNFALSRLQEKQISKKMKIERVIVNRLFSIFKYILTLKSPENKIFFKEEIKNVLKNTDGATFNIKKFMKNRKPYSPFIDFYDEDFKFDIEEYSNIFSANQQSEIFKIFFYFLFLIFYFLFFISYSYFLNSLFFILKFFR